MSKAQTKVPFLSILPIFVLCWVPALFAGDGQILTSISTGSNYIFTQTELDPTVLDSRYCQLSRTDAGELGILDQLGLPRLEFFDTDTQAGTIKTCKCKMADGRSIEYAITKPLNVDGYDRRSRKHTANLPFAVPLDPSVEGVSLLNSKFYYSSQGTEKFSDNAQLSWNSSYFTYAASDIIAQKKTAPDESSQLYTIAATLKGPGGAERSDGTQLPDSVNVDMSIMLACDYVFLPYNIVFDINLPFSGTMDLSDRQDILESLSNHGIYTIQDYSCGKFQSAKLDKLIFKGDNGFDLCFENVTVLTNYYISSCVFGRELFNNRENAYITNGYSSGDVLMVQYYANPGLFLFNIWSPYWGFPSTFYIELPQ